MDEKSRRWRDYGLTMGGLSANFKIPRSTIYKIAKDKKVQYNKIARTSILRSAFGKKPLTTRYCWLDDLPARAFAQTGTHSDTTYLHGNRLGRADGLPEERGLGKAPVKNEGNE